MVATVCDLVLRLILRGYREAEPGMVFSATMLVGRLAIGLVASIASGVVTRLAAGRASPAPWVVGIALLAAFVPMHVELWSRFPVAYHLFFLTSLIAMPPLAARTTTRFER